MPDASLNFSGFLHRWRGATMERPYDYRRYAILYVDDEEKSLKYFARVFRDKFTILGAANAQEGYRLLEEHRDAIALLMVDQRMPGEKGVKFLREARRLHPNAIRILTTAYSDFEVAVEAVNSAGISNCIIKPWDIAQLETILKRACESYALLQDQDLIPKSEISEPQQMIFSDPATRFEDLQTPEQVARYLKVNKFTVYRLLARKKIPGFKVGNQWRFKQDVIDAWLAAKSNLRKKKSTLSPRGRKGAS
jgi:excisionase family DNA binding protein